MRIILLSFIFFLKVFFLSGQELTWPREVKVDQYDVTLYQPQLESFKNNILEGRMAVSVKSKKGEPIFGAMWFKALMETDLDERLVLLKNIDITQMRFPDVEQEKINDFSRALEETIESFSEPMSLDRILASLDMVEEQRDLSTHLNNDPPVIFYRQESAVLVFIDGDPVYQDTDEKGISFVVNTPFFLVRDNNSDDHYLRGGKFWYTTKSIQTDWKSIEKVPSAIFKLSEKALEGYNLEEDSVMMAMTEAPELIVSTKPAELILVDGVPDFKPINNTSLLYIDNTENDILMDITKQEYYVLLSGRWYYSKSLKDGEWRFMEPGTLPEDFAKIPVESDMANVRTSVPGTEEAQDAVLEQTIPQTATVDRKTATVTVQYDGDPKFSRITNTGVAYAENADKTVLMIDSRYYCIDNAIWFESENPDGPWEVSVERPQEVDNIPPESPVYNVKYVYIYDYTPDVVYVGYTPGYTCSYVYGGVVVYGTGYYYQPWYGYYYYPRPVTYGFHVHYNPWTGWGFSYGVSYGWMSVTFRTGGYGYWGPAGYRYGYRHGYYHGYHHGYQRGYAAGARRGYMAGQAASNRNVYQNRANGVRTTGIQTRPANNRASAGTRDRSMAGNQVSNRQGRPATSDNRSSNINRPDSQTRPSRSQNDIYAGRDGNVYRKDNQGNVQQRNNGQWNNTNRTSQSYQQINRESQARQRGTSNYQSRSSNAGRSAPSSRPTGGRRR